MGEILLIILLGTFYVICAVWFSNGVYRNRMERGDYYTEWD